MGYIQRRLGIAKPIMWGSLGVFHLFLAARFLTGQGTDTIQTGTGLLLVVVGTGMLLWGYSHRQSS